MQFDLGDGAASNNGSAQLLGETPLTLGGLAHLHTGKKQAREAAMVPYAASLTEALRTSFPTAASPAPDILDTQILMNFDAQTAWANFNSRFPTKSFNPEIGCQQAGATIKNVFNLNSDASQINLGAVLDPSVLPHIDAAMDSIPPPAQPATKVHDKAAAIPLICHLCPSKPTFSDVSHLLTHVSSKSHLAAEFKLKHSKKIEDQDALVQYAQWAQDNGVNELVANRIAAKEQKKAPRKQRAVGNEHLKKKNLKNIKSETRDDLQSQLQHAPPISNANAWHLHTPRDNSFDDSYHTPTNKNFLSAHQYSDSPRDSAYIKQETSRSGTEVPNFTFPLEPAVPADNELNVTKLKGVVYPGMSIFDAATDEQRRKRNQKKHESVLQNMMFTSESVEQFECVWDEDMSEITRTRNVYDSPSIDGNPDDRDEVPSTGKKRRGRRAVVANSGPRRQTRASTRAASGKLGKRRAVASKEKDPKIDVLGSENDTNTPLRAHGRNVFGGDAGEADDGSMEEDVFQERRQARRGAAASPIPSLPFGHPTAMQPLPANLPLNTSSMFNKPNVPNYFDSFGMKENDSNISFPLQQPLAMSSYFVPQSHNMQSNGFNPLCVQRQDSFPFLYGNSSFDNSKSSTPAFQPMKGVDFNNMGSATPFPTGNAQHEDFDI